MIADVHGFPFYSCRCNHCGREVEKEELTLEEFEEVRDTFKNIAFVESNLFNNTTRQVRAVRCNISMGG